MIISVIIVLTAGQIPVLGDCAWLAIILVDMMIAIAPAAWAKARPRMRVVRRSWTRLTPSSGQIAVTWQRGLVIMHGLVAPFLGVIALAIILLLVGLVALCILVVTLTTIMLSIISMSIVRLVIVSSFNHFGCFKWNRGICGNNAAGSLIHGFSRQKDEPFSFPLAASSPWQSSQECQPPCWLLDTAQRKQSSWAGW